MCNTKRGFYMPEFVLVFKIVSTAEVRYAKIEIHTPRNPAALDDAARFAWGGILPYP